MAFPPKVTPMRALPWAWIWMTAAVLSLLAVLAFGLRRDPRALPSPLVGRPAPAFALELFDGRHLAMADLGGKVVVLNFWASWCVPACTEEAPHLQDLWTHYGSRGVVVVGVNIQDREAPARDFIRRFAQTFPNGMDPGGVISIDYGVYGVPETFVIDRHGRTVFKHAGAVTEELLVLHIEPLLEPR